MKTVKDCKDVFMMSPQDEQWRRTIVYSVCILQFSCFTKYNRIQSKHEQTKCEHSRRNSCRLQLSQLVSRITKLNQRVIWKDDIELVTEFPCLLGHPAYNFSNFPGLTSFFWRVFRFFSSFSTLSTGLHSSCNLSSIHHSIIL